MQNVCYTIEIAVDSWIAGSGACFAFISNLLIILFLGKADVSGLGAVHPRLQACTWPIRYARFAA
jgi:hypothetical protein